MFSKVLVANRGEIAVRVMRALKELEIGSVAVYSEADRHALHAHEADEAYLLGAGLASESYLNVKRIIRAARESGAKAVHPGYGFLAENSAFARGCADAGLVFIGPPPDAIDAMGSKTKSREIMQRAGVPIVPGTTDPVETVVAAKAIIADFGYPVAIKAAGGGGGKGFRVALSEEELEKAFEGASREGEKFFADPTVYIERYLDDPRHIEVQILADDHGNIVHLGERDCSVQRRHQKVIEETPAPCADDEMRERIGQIAIEAARAVDYRSAGTVEGLLDGAEYYFLEMNTRVQVEHTVTEMATGIDIVREQIAIAAGNELSFSQEDVDIRGSAIECRINAEAAHKNFAPAPGTVTSYREPAGPGIRIDSGVLSGSDISPLYDPMIAKLIVWDRDREAATRRMLRALHEYEIEGIATLIPFHKAILASDQWRRGETCRDLVTDRKWLKSLAPENAAATPADNSNGGKEERTYLVEVNERLFNVKVIGDAPQGGGGSSSAGQPSDGFKPRPRRERSGGAGQGDSGGSIIAPMQGTVLKVAVEEGRDVGEGDLICVVEAMKMENEVTATGSGKIAKLNVTEGTSIAAGDVIAVVE